MQLRGKLVGKSDRVSSGREAVSSLIPSKDRSNLYMII